MFTTKLIQVSRSFVCISIIGFFSFQLSGQEDTAAPSLFGGMNLGAFRSSDATAKYYDGSAQYGLEYMFGSNFFRAEYFDRYFNNNDHTLGELPENMQYRIAWLIGGHAGVRFNSRISVLLDLDFIQLRLSDVFTVNVIQFTGNAIDNNTNIQRVGIEGRERRMNINLGVGFDIAKMGLSTFYVETKAHFNSIQFEESYMVLGDKKLPLPRVPVDVNGQPLPNTANLNPSGIGYGIIGGLGIKRTLNEKLSADIGYNAFMTNNQLTESYAGWGLQHTLYLRILWGT